LSLRAISGASALKANPRLDYPGAFRSDVVNELS